MENEKSIGNEHEADLPASVQEYQKTLSAYRGGIEGLALILKKTTFRKLTENPKKLQAYEEIIIDTIEKVENLGRSPPSWVFKKSEVIKNLQNAQVELGKAQHFLSYAKSDPRVSVDSMNHIHPCQGYLDLAASLMVIVQRKKRT
jgi:hypothetical protein